MEQFHGINDGNINISDVIEVIQTTDPEFVESNVRVEKEKMEVNTSGRIMPYVEILEQPASKALRFRYECEGRSAGSIPGVNSTPENKTFPSIRILGYKGRAVVVVSCVTKDPPYRPHPHNLVGKEACKRGVCTIEISSENMTVTFANLGIQCVKKKDIEDALRVREEIRVDPFRTGFDHKRQPTSIDLNAVRLCFQVFLEGTQKGKFNVPLPPIVSDPIYDKKAMSDLVICKLSHCSASVAGGTEMILLCEKVAKEDIQVRFFEEKDGHLAWEGFGDFQPTHVHKQTAIAFRTPSYRVQQVEQPVQVFIQLKRPSDGATSEPLPFQMLPLGAGRPAFWSLRKAFARKKADFGTFSKILASETALLSNVTSSRNIDDFNNNDLEVKNNKISALRALNDLYNVKNSMESRNDLRILRTNAPTTTTMTNNQSSKDRVVDFENNEVLVVPRNKADTVSIDYALNNVNNNGAFVTKIVQGENVGEDDGTENVCRNDISITGDSTRPSKSTDDPKNRSDWFDYSEVGKWVQKGQECLKEKSADEDFRCETEDGSKSLNELLSQVAELDQIYADTHTKLLQAALNEQNTDNGRPVEMDVCDNQTYTSLQLAMKNPVELFDIRDDRKYEDVTVEKFNTSKTTPPSIPSPSLPAKRDVTREFEEGSNLPPLPPKRIRKTPSMPLLPRPISSHTLLESSSVAPNKNLPSVPGGTLPKPAKQGLFSKLFAKKTKKDKNSGIEERDSSIRFFNSASNISSLSRNDSHDVTHFPRPSMASVTSVKSFNMDSDDTTPPYGMDLTEAEHYALYTTMAPRATASEFDEMSFYYSPVEGGKILSDAKES